MIPVNSPYYEEYSCHRRPMCQQTVLSFQLSLRVRVFNSISFRVMKKSDKSAGAHVSALYDTL